MRKLFLTALAVLAVLGVGMVPAQAAPAVPSAAVSVEYVQLNVTNGMHNHTFYSCTVDGRRARAYIRYEISGGDWFQLKEILWETNWGSHPAFEGNAARLDLEIYPDYYGEVSPAWGGSSTTLNDMPSWYSALYASQDLFSFNLSDTPALRFRFYGVGAGSVGGRCDDYEAVE